MDALGECRVKREAEGGRGEWVGDGGVALERGGGRGGKGREGVVMRGTEGHRRLAPFWLDSNLGIRVCTQLLGQRGRTYRTARGRDSLAGTAWPSRLK